MKTKNLHNAKHTLVGLFILLIACSYSKNNLEERDNVSIENINSKKDSIINFTDTLSGNFSVKYTIKEISINPIVKKSILSTGDTILYEYKNRIIDLDLNYNQNTIKRTISKDDFTSIIPIDKINKYQIGNFYLENISDSLVTFSLNICVPDTDDCYFFLLSVSSVGVITISEEEVEWEE